MTLPPEPHRWTIDLANGQRMEAIAAFGFTERQSRFLLHVLPRGFVRIRHFGLLANGQRRATIARARRLLGAPTPAAPGDHESDADRDHTLCPLCRHGHWQVVEILRPIAPALTPATPDTS